jgi:hypothetical protein
MGSLDPERPVLCWLAYYADWSGMKVFSEEIDALRHAVGTSMQVMPLYDGEDIR